MLENNGSSVECGGRHLDDTEQALHTEQHDRLERVAIRTQCARQAAFDAQCALAGAVTAAYKQLLLVVAIIVR
jgi:hypothetical protein